MFGRLLGKALALPVRIVNAPFRLVDKVVDPNDNLGPSCAPLTEVGDAIEDVVAETFGDAEEKRR
jgi:hypothetical protein